MKRIEQSELAKVARGERLPRLTRVGAFSERTKEIERKRLRDYLAGRTVRKENR